MTWRPRSKHVVLATVTCAAVVALIAFLVVRDSGPSERALATTGDGSRSSTSTSMSTSSTAESVAPSTSNASSSTTVAHAAPASPTTTSRRSGATVTTTTVPDVTQPGAATTTTTSDPCVRQGDDWIIARDAGDQYALHSFRSDGSCDAVIVSGGTNSYPSWSPAHDRFATVNPLVVFEARGAPGRVVLNSNSTAVAWSPSGERLVVGEVGDDWSRLATVRDDGTDYRVVAELGRGNRVYNLTWSPDGSTLLFNYYGGGGLWEVPAGGGTPELVRETGIQPDWGRDGRVLFVDGTSVMVMNSDGSGPRPIGPPPSRGGVNPKWSPDQTHVMYSAMAGNEAAIYTVEPSGANERLVIKGLSFADW